MVLYIQLLNAIFNAVAQFSHLCAMQHCKIVMYKYMIKFLVATKKKGWLCLRQVTKTRLYMLLMFTAAV